MQIGSDIGAWAFLHSARGLVQVLDGQGDRIHTVNVLSPPNLSQDELLMAYLRFFCAAIRAEEGRFHLVGTVAELPWLETATPESKATIETQIQPTIRESDENGMPVVSATVLYGRFLFISRFRVPADGKVDMFDDTPIAQDLPVRSERFVGPLRFEEAQ